ncbi:MAG: DUF418 domain-containing protein [Acidobacteria bacterium]|nr:DUF418 domain-containing protein [Acidobacteriota bacterium]
MPVPEELTEVSSPSAAAPTSRAERISSIDAVRGFALLGILLMNIVPMGMNGAAYDDPTVTGGSTGANLGIWFALHVLAEGKMRCLFSLIFGVSVMLFTARLDERRDGADLYFRRSFWMMAFGIVHAYLLWVGEILYPYALCSLLLYPFRHWPAKRLILMAGLFIAGDSCWSVINGFTQRDMLRDGKAALAASQSGRKLSDTEQEAKREYEDFMKDARPDAAALQKDIDEWRKNPLTVIQARGRMAYRFHREPYYFGWDIWSMMFLGMGLYRLGLFNASTGTLAKLLLAGYGIGIPLNTYTGWLIVNSNFDPVMHSWAGSSYDVGRLSVALGHLSLVVLLWRKQWLTPVTSALAAVGQMAFSNYILHSVLTAFIFTGYGFKLYGTLQRIELYWVVAAMWTISLIVSPIWLRHYRFGPMEWCWRSLTYWKKQPMRLAA